MTCPHCQRANRVDRRFCGGCGTSLTSTCTGCDYVNDVVDHFCGGCGISTPALSEVVHLPNGGVPMISLAELESLIAEVPMANAPVASLPQGPIAQDDLDRLFGGIE